MPLAAGRRLARSFASKSLTRISRIQVTDDRESKRRHHCLETSRREKSWVRFPVPMGGRSAYSSSSPGRGASSEPRRSSRASAWGMLAR